ncbi:hypothetical protein DFH08DRAFT_1090097 [Mycena albidolilacea]|uniref:Uncharacterized protein n=1 Tax=Mycena albidolilacea TaxID=1033008 RepID=A0AAD7E7J3_9AGAR|nr:hypothetical protein DFH08DRAFT_1090097 [Mycena albidolilacea]
MEASPSVLPAELECRIFEICAHSQPKFIPELMLVARRFKDWCVRFFPSQTCPEFFPPSFSPAQHLLYEPAPGICICATSPNTLTSILSVCTGVENLWTANIQVHDIPSIACLPLKHFRGPLQILLKSLLPTHRVFSQMTHIELHSDEPVDDMKIWSALGDFPQLTHLSFHDEEFIPLCSDFLETCKSLAVLVALTPIEESSKAGAEAIAAQDVRFVVMNRGAFGFLKDW